MKYTIGPQIRQAVEELVKNPICNESFAQRAFVDTVPPEAELAAFVQGSGLYDNHLKRWMHLPTAPQRDVEVHPAVYQIIQTALGHFGFSRTRQIVLCPRSTATQSNLSNGPIILPDILPLVIGSKSSSASVVDPIRQADNLYLQCTSPVLVTAESHSTEVIDLVQVAIFATFCFFNQHNRNTVYCLKITESTVILYAFDHGGVYHTPKIDIHRHPTIFLRLILGINSLDDTAIGFDDNVFWKARHRYIRITSNETSVNHKLTSSYPLYFQGKVKDTATTCWKARDSTKGMDLLIKDIWAPDNGNLEIQLLKTCKGLRGVSQIVAYQVLFRISDMRRRNMRPENAPKSNFTERVLTRIVFEDSGKPIVEFESAAQLLYAIRDAIIGHQNLYNLSILHRDVSVGNILIGMPGSGVGNRGVLIDLSLAIRRDRLNLPEAIGSGVVGTRPFLSINNLERLKSGRTVSPHGYLDDLESFFYVFCTLLFRYSGPKTLMSPPPTFLLDWNNPSHSAAQAAKKAMYYDKCLPALISDFFGPPFERLFMNLLEFFDGKIKSRKHGAQLDPAAQVDQPGDVALDYARIVGFYDEAIAEVEGSSGTTSVATFGNPTPASVGSPSGLSLSVSRPKGESVQGTHKRRRQNNSVKGNGGSKKKRGEN